MEKICSYEGCQTCHCKNCMTGQIAREKGEEAYDKFVEAMAESEIIE